MHTIRLRGPWQAEWAGESPGRQAIYTRSFHRPTGLTEAQGVSLVLEPVRNSQFGWSTQLESIILNDRQLVVESALPNSKARVSIPVAEYLQTFNQVQVLVTFKCEVLDSLATVPPPLEHLLSVALAIEDQ